MSYYYGQNFQTRENIIFDRRNSPNPNGILTGAAGSGKSVMVCGEILQVLSESLDRVVVLTLFDDYQYERLEEYAGTKMGMDTQKITVSSPNDWSTGNEKNARLTIFNLDALEPRDKKNTMLNLVEDIIQTHFGDSEKLWVYLDDLSFLDNNVAYSKKMYDLWFRAKQANCILTGLEQGIEYLTNTPAGRLILDHSGLLVLLPQSVACAYDFLEQHPLSADIRHLLFHDRFPGEGAIVIEGETIPLKYKIPEESALFHLIFW